MRTNEEEKRRAYETISGYSYVIVDVQTNDDGSKEISVFGSLDPVEGEDYTYDAVFIISEVEYIKFIQELENMKNYIEIFEN